MENRRGIKEKGRKNYDDDGGDDDDDDDDDNSFVLK